MRHKCVVVPATVAAVRPAGTNHALSLIKIVIFVNVGFVGGADVVGHDVSGGDVGGDDVGRDDVGGDDVGGDDVGGDDVSEDDVSRVDVRTTNNKVGDGGGGRPDHHDQPSGEPSKTATAPHQWCTRWCLAYWRVRQQLEPLLLLLFRPFRPQHLVFPPPHHPS